MHRRLAPDFMSETVGVVISSYGSREPWNTLAMRAMTSVTRQTRPPDAVFRIHHNTLHEARNKGGQLVGVDWLCFLDCDDELEPNYLELMMESGEPNELRYPRVRYVTDGFDPKCPPEPRTLQRKPLWQGNFMVIGTLVRRSFFLAAGGFRELPAYEDWDLWIRCWLLGCNPTFIPTAVYRAWRRPDGRNAPGLIDSPTDLCARIVEYNRRWLVCHPTVHRGDKDL